MAQSFYMGVGYCAERRSMFSEKRPSQALSQGWRAMLRRTPFAIFAPPSNKQGGGEGTSLDQQITHEERLHAGSLISSPPLRALSWERIPVRVMLAD